MSKEIKRKVVKLKKNFKLDEFYYHEALDRTHVMCEIIDSTLINHPVFCKHKKLRKKIEKAQSILFRVYQDVGNIEYFKFEKPD